MATLEAAQAAVKARDYPKALELYNQAVDAEPTAEALAARAAVHNKMRSHMEAAADAGRAVELSAGLAAAHKEKGLALYSLEEFEGALDAFESASKLEPGKNIHKQWLNMCRVQLGEEPEAPPSRTYEPPTSAIARASLDDKAPSGSGGKDEGEGGKKGNSINLSGEQLQAFLRAAQAGNLPAALRGGGEQGPAAAEEEEEEGSEQPRAARLDDPEFSKYWKAPISAAVAASIPDKPAGAKYRHQWFQSPDRVEVDVLAKGLQKEQVGVTIEERRLRVVTIGADGQQDYDLDVELHAPILPDSSRFAVLGTKIEIKLQKTEGGRQWPALEAGAAAAAPAAAAAAPAAAPAAAAAAPAPAEAAAPEAAPAPAAPGPAAVYPYAGKKVDWDKFAEEIKKEEKEEKLEGDQALMKFFRELYDGGDEDTRRAMVKSMQESGGTALSMNWGEVGRKDYSKKGKGEEEEEEDEDWGRPARRR